MNSNLFSFILSCSHFSKLRYSLREASAAKSITKENGRISRIGDKAFYNCHNRKCY